jgi:hypothetical protein
MGGWRIGLARCASPHGYSNDRYDDIQTRHGRLNNPDFYRQIGKDPEHIVRDALDVLASRFNLH